VLLQVSPTLDKVGVFCRQVLDCAVVVDALTPLTPPGPAGAQQQQHQQQQQQQPGGGKPPTVGAAPSGQATAATGTTNGGSSSSSSNSSSSSTQHDVTAGRLHLQDADQAVAFNYSQFLRQPCSNGSSSGSPSAGSSSSAQQQLSCRSYRQQQQQWQAAGLLLPPSFRDLPRLDHLCIGFLQDTPATLVDVLQTLNPRGCFKGPLAPPGNSLMVSNVLSVLLQVEAAVSFEGLWLEGFITDDSHW
jgi:hypothetical protein